MSKYLILVLRSMFKMLILCIVGFCVDVIIIKFVFFMLIGNLSNDDGNATKQ